MKLTKQNIELYDFFNDKIKKRTDNIIFKNKEITDNIKILNKYYKSISKLRTTVQNKKDLSKEIKKIEKNLMNKLDTFLFNDTSDELDKEYNDFIEIIKEIRKIYKGLFTQIFKTRKILTLKELKEIKNNLDTNLVNYFIEKVLENGKISMDDNLLLTKDMQKIFSFFSYINNKLSFSNLDNSEWFQTEILSNLLKSKFSVIGEPSRNGIAIKAWIKGVDDEVVLKISKLDVDEEEKKYLDGDDPIPLDSLMNEYINSKMLNRMSLIIPNFTVNYGLFYVKGTDELEKIIKGKSKTAQKIFDDKIDSNIINTIKNPEPGYLVLMNEYVPAPTPYWTFINKVNKNIPLHIITNINIQIMAALVFAEKKYGYFIHNDLHFNNILLTFINNYGFNLDRKKFIYKIDNTEYISYSSHLAKIIDYGRCSLKGGPEKNPRAFTLSDFALFHSSYFTYYDKTKNKTAKLIGELLQLMFINNKKNSYKFLADKMMKILNDPKFKKEVYPELETDETFTFTYE